MLKRQGQTRVGCGWACWGLWTVKNYANDWANYVRAAFISAYAGTSVCIFAADLWATSRWLTSCPWQQMPSIEKLVNKKRMTEKQNAQKSSEENILEKYFPSLAVALIYLWMKLCMKTEVGVIVFLGFVHMQARAFLIGECEEKKHLISHPLEFLALVKLS